MESDLLRGSIATTCCRCRCKKHPYESCGFNFTGWSSCRAQSDSGATRTRKTTTVHTTHQATAQLYRTCIPRVLNQTEKAEVTKRELEAALRKRTYSKRDFKFPFLSCSFPCPAAQQLRMTGVVRTLLTQLGTPPTSCLRGLCSLPCSQEPTSGPCPEPNIVTTHSHTPFL
jgi:hypothetical protein